MDCKRIMAEAQRTGTVWLGGEMEFPLNSTAREAFAQCCKVAEACGYLVRGVHRDSFEVTGGDIPGTILCDWYSSEARQVGKIELTAVVSVAYNDSPDRLPAPYVRPAKIGGAS